MHADPSSSNLPVKKKWETPNFYIIDSNQPEGGLNNAFVEHSVKNGNYYLETPGNATLQVPKAAFDAYEHS
jgi:hypothetical protein